MDEHRQDSRYEELYTQLLERGMDLHANNKRRIRIGLILLLLLPAILGIILKMTGSDKIVFLLIWVFCMFVICIYLITIEYIDDSVRKTLEEVTDREADFDELLVDSEKLEERIASRREELRERVRQLREEKGAAGDGPLLRESEGDE